MKASGIGGQALMEGVMMKNGSHYACAVRKPDGTIEVDDQHTTSLGDKSKFFKLPIIRGVVTFAESLVIGIKTLTWSASFFEDEDETEKTASKANETKNADEEEYDENRPAQSFSEIRQTINKEKNKEEKRKEGLLMGLMVFFAVVLAVGIFMILPYFISKFLKEVIESTVLLAVVEGLIRITLFVGYVAAISCMKDIKRVFMYHGAEHKSINCVESGLELNVENVRKCSREHKRCGTSFLLIVMVISIIFFMFIRFESTILMVVGRILLVPVIAGLSYEFIRLAGRTDNKVVAVLSKPGLALQKLTTREPDDSMIECAIASVEAVFDWRAFQEDARAEEEAKRNDKASIKDKRRREREKEIRQRREAKGIIDTDLSEEEIKEIDARIDSLQGQEIKDDELSEALAREAADKAKSLAKDQDIDIENTEEDVKDNLQYPDRNLLDSSDEEEDDEVLNALNKYFKE
ncbi:MAG: DUF1385 domain-containing protein [Lachnospiraceae bacterium]|nr:DUF1385 domain-containing protein [Lachnospiraceae bacterium]